MSVSRSDVERILGCPQRLETRLEPIRGMATGRIHAFEGLVREPGRDSRELFSSATALGLDIHLELVALGRVLEHLDGPRLQGGARLAVNLSPAVVVLEAVLRLLEPVADRLIVEVSELASGPSTELVARALSPLREIGLLVALDNAGAGYAGLERIALLVPDIVKLDRSLVASIEAPATRRLAEITTRAAHAVGALVVAVGIEHPGQLTWARTAQVDAWQGFLAEVPRVTPIRCNGVLAVMRRGDPPRPPRVAIDADSSLDRARYLFGRVGLLGPRDVASVVAGRLALGWVCYGDLQHRGAEISA